jgi:trigger factor
VDVALLVEGERHEQGSATGYPLEVGSDNLFPELNESLVGAKVGEERRVPVNYPADFHRPELAGKSGEFVVTVRQIKERQLPELTDEFVRQQTSITSVEKLRERMRRGLEAVGEAMAESNLRNELLSQVVEASQVELPGEPVEREVARRAAAVEEEVERQGVSLESYLARRGFTEQAWRRSLATEARNDLRRALALDAIGRAEHIHPTDKEIDRELAEQAKEEGRTPEQVRRRLERADDLDRIVNRVYHRKVMEFLVRNAEVTSETAAAQEVAPAEPEATRTE